MRRALTRARTHTQTYMDRDKARQRELDRLLLKFTKGKAWDPSNRDEGEGAEKRGRGIKIRCLYGGGGGGELCGWQ